MRLQSNRCRATERLFVPVLLHVPTKLLLVPNNRHTLCSRFRSDSHKRFSGVLVNHKSFCWGKNGQDLALSVCGVTTIFRWEGLIHQNQARETEDFQILVTCVGICSVLPIAPVLSLCNRERIPFRKSMQPCESDRAAVPKRKKKPLSGFSRPAII